MSSFNSSVMSTSIIWMGEMFTFFPPWQILSLGCNKVDENKEERRGIPHQTRDFTIFHSPLCLSISDSLHYPSPFSRIIYLFNQINSDFPFLEKSLSKFLNRMKETIFYLISLLFPGCIRKSERCIAYTAHLPCHLISEWVGLINF